nr:MAG TPA: hypothetical protein [Bacteriophage sp.]
MAECKQRKCSSITNPTKLTDNNPIRQLIINFANMKNHKFKYLHQKVRLAKSLWYHGFDAVLDGKVNSVTISRRLYRHMMSQDRPSQELIVFSANDSHLYSFAFRADYPQLHAAQTAFTELQYNTEHHKIGFRTDQPSVTAILHDYGLPTDACVRLSVLPRHTASGEVFYEIQRPPQKG